MKLTGLSILGFRAGSATKEVFHATNARTGERLETDFYSATPEEVDAAATLADEAFAVYSRTTGREKAVFLRAIATNIESIAPELIERAEQETALPKARLQGETARTPKWLRKAPGSWLASTAPMPSVNLLPSRTYAPCCVP
jgi:2,5-dioxopentanoate dehydrogenase